MTVVDEATNTITDSIVAPGNGGFTIVNDPVHQKVFAVSYVGANVSVIDTRTEKVTANITPAGAGNSLGVAVDPLNGKYYVSVESGFATGSIALSQVNVYRESDNKLINTIQLPLFPQDLAVDPIRGILYVEAGPAGPYTLYAIDVKTDQIIATIALPEAAETGIAIDIDRGLVYLQGSGCANVSGCSVPGSVFVVDETTNALTQQIIATPFPQVGNENVVIEEVAIDPVNGIGYAASFRFGTLSIFDLRTNELIDTITIPNDKLFGVAVDPIRRNVYTTGVLTGNLYVISAGPAKSTWYDPYTLE